MATVATPGHRATHRRISAVVEVSFQYRSVRARNARLAAHLRVPGAAEIGSFAIVAVAAVYLLSQHHTIGWSVTGVATLIAIVGMWHRWDIKGDDTPKSGLNNDRIQLERVVEPRLLARLNPQMNAAEVWGAALHQWEGVFVVQRLQLPHQAISELLAELPSQVIWTRAVELGRAFNLRSLDSSVVIIAILLEYKELQPVLQQLAIKPEDCMTVLAWQQRVATALASYRHPAFTGGIGRDWAVGYTPMLNQIGTNLSQQVQGGSYRFIPEEHEKLVTQLVELVAQNHPLALVGGIGSGKTTLMQAFAEHLLTSRHVGKLAFHQIIALNATVLISSGEQIEDLVLQLLGEAAHSKNTILFLDDAQVFLQKGTGSIDLTHILLPILQQRSIKIVLALSDHDWQKLSANQPGFAAALQRLVLNETSPSDTMAILQDSAIGLEHAAQATVLHEALIEAIRLSERYLPEAVFPGRAITVLESASHYAQDGFITAASVQQAIEATTGAKVTKASAPERQQLLNLENQIHDRMINQVHAVKVVADALRRARAGVTNPKRPIGSFLFLGPTGVGKTELAKSLAAIYFGAEDSMVRLDMSEYQQPTDVARLLSPNAGSESGHTLTSGVRQRPSTVVLLDEIEKAHPDILNLLLQVLDEGRLTDSEGRPVSFKDAIVIATSNAGADSIRAHIAKGEPLEQFDAAITKELIDSHQFRPELLNRFDEIVIFRPLEPAELRQVVDLLLKGVNATLANQNVTVALTPAASDWLVKRGNDPAFGARPLRRMVQRTVENLVAERLLGGSVKPGQTITFDAPDLEKAAPTTTES